MSISSPQTGGSRRPSTRPAAGAKKAAPAAAKAATPAKSGPAKSTGGKGGGRPPVTPVKVRQGRNWGAIGLSAIVALIAVGIVGFGVYEVFKSSQTWQDKANGIPG